MKTNSLGQVNCASHSPAAVAMKFGGLRFACGFIGFASFAAAAPSAGCAHKVKESIHPPPGWVAKQLAPHNHGVKLRIGLPQPNFSVLEQHLYEVSDPDSPRYGQHLSKEETEELVAPHPDSLAAVENWLASHGLTADNGLHYSPAKDWISIHVPVSLAEKMLDTVCTSLSAKMLSFELLFQKYHVWTHTESGDSLVRTTSYSLPEDLHEHVDVVQPTTSFARTKGLKTTFSFVPEANIATTSKDAAPFVDPVTGVTVDPSCNTTITVTCLKQLYNAVGFEPSDKNGNSFAVTG